MDSEVTITSIIFIVLLIVPGVFFKRFYFQGPFSKQFASGLFADRLITSIFWGILIQILSFWIFSKSFNLTFDNVKKPISEVYFKLSKNTIPDFSTQNLKLTLIYLLLSIIFSCVLGGLFNVIIRKLKIDIKFPTFRFANHWHYYFKGEILTFSDFKAINKKGKVLSTIVDVVIDVDEGDKKKMLSGFLTQYIISQKTGELETLYLTNPSRFSNSQNKFVEIPGDCLIIPYHRVIDMNLRYVIKEDKNKLKEQIINSFISISIFIGLLIVLIAPWFIKEVGVLRKIISVILLIVDWLILITIILSFQNKIDNSLKGKSLLVAIFTSISLTFFALYLLRILNV